jgi:hypothetical protein
MTAANLPLAAEKDIPRLEKTMEKMPFTKVSFTLNRKAQSK